MAAMVMSAQDRGAIRLSTEAGVTLGMWDLAERHRHMVFWETIHEIASRLKPLGAGTAVIKGVATEARWYDETGQRVCTDVDLLLDPDAFDDTVEVVRRLDPDRGLSSSIDWLVQRRLLQHVDLRVGPTQVDLHFDPLKVGIPTRQLDEVWTSMQTLETAHGTIRVLRPEVELVLLLLHLNKDRYAFLGAFLDIRQILDRATLDWGYLQAFVAEEGLEVPVWKSLAAVAHVLSLDIDAPRVGGPRTLTWDRLWGGPAMLKGYEGREGAPSVQRFLPFHATRRGGEVIREVWRQVVPPRQLIEVAGRLGPGRSYLRYLTVDRFRADSPGWLP
jgi:hypothetical protein